MTKRPGYGPAMPGFSLSCFGVIFGGFLLFLLCFFYVTFVTKGNKLLFVVRVAVS